MEVEINENSNQNLIDNFMHLVDLCIESGDINQLKIVINSYNSLIPKLYIDMAERIYNELIIEKLEDLNINS